MHFAKAKFRDKANNEDGFVFSQGGSVESVHNIESTNIDLATVEVSQELRDSTEDYNSFLSADGYLYQNGYYSGKSIKETKDGNFSLFSALHESITYRYATYHDNFLPQNENPGYLESKHSQFFFLTSQLLALEFTKEAIPLKDYEIISDHYKTRDNYATKWSNLFEPNHMGLYSDQVATIVSEITIRINISNEEGGGYNGSLWEIILEKSEDAELVLEQSSSEFFWSRYKHKQTTVSNTSGSEVSAFFEDSERIDKIDILTQKVNQMDTVSGLHYYQDLGRDYSPPVGTPYANRYHPPIDLIQNFEVNAIKAQFGSEKFGLVKIDFWGQNEIVFNHIGEPENNPTYGYILKTHKPSWVTGEFLSAKPVPYKVRSEEGITLTFSREPVDDSIPGFYIWQNMITKATLTIPPGVTGFFYEPGDHEILTWTVENTDEFGRVLTNGNDLELSFSNTYGATLKYDGYYDINLGGSDEIFLEEYKESSTFDGASEQREIGKLNNEITKWTTTEHVDHLPSVADEEGQIKNYPSNVKQITDEVHNVMLELAKGDQITVNVASYNLGGLSNLASFDAIDIYDRTDVIIAIGDANLNGIWEKDDLETVEGYQNSSVANLSSTDTISYTSRDAAKNSHGFRLGNNAYAKQNSLYNETSLYLGDNTVDPFNSADPEFFNNLSAENEVNIYPPQGYLTKTNKSDRIESYSQNNLGEIDKIYIGGYKYLAKPKLHSKLKTVEYIENAGVVEEIKISIEISGVTTSYIFPYLYTGVEPRTDKATGKKFYRTYSLVIDGKRKYLIVKLSRDLHYPHTQEDINSFSPEFYYYIGFDLSEEGGGSSSEWYIQDAYKTFDEGITEYTAVGDISIVSLDGKFAPEYKSQIGNYEQKLTLDYNEGVKVTEVINECTFTVDENNYVTAIHHAGFNFYDSISSGLAGGVTAKGQFYNLYKSGTTVGEIEVQVSSVDGTFYVDTLTWKKPSGETVVVLSQTAKGRTGINTLNSIDLESNYLIQEEIDFSTTYFTANITKGLTKDSPYSVSNGLSYNVPIGSRIENGSIGKVNTESTTRIIEPFDKDFGYYPNKIDFSNLVLGDWNYSEGVSELEVSPTSGSDNLTVQLSKEYFDKTPTAMITDPTFKEGLTHWNTDGNIGEIPFQTTLGNIRISTTPKLAGFNFEPVFVNGDGASFAAVIGDQNADEGLVISRVGTLPSIFFYEQPLPNFDPNSSFDYTSSLSRMGKLMDHSLIENIDIQWDSTENKHKFTVIFDYPNYHYAIDVNGGWVSQDIYDSKAHTFPKNINHLHLAAGSTYKFKNTTFSPTFWLNDTEANGGTEISTTQDSEYTTLSLPFETFKNVEKIYYNIGTEWGELHVSLPVYNDYMGANVGIFYNQLKLATSRKKQKTDKALYINDCYSLTDWTNYTSSAHDQLFLENLTQSLGISLELPPVSEGAMYVTWNDIKDDWIAGVMSDDRKWQILKHTMFDPRDYFKGLDNQGEVKSVTHWYNHFNQYDCIIWNARALQKDGQPIHPNFIQGLLQYQKNGGGIIFTSGDLGYSHFWRKHVSPHFGITHKDISGNIYGSPFIPTNNEWESEGWIGRKGSYPASSFLPEQPNGYFGNLTLESIRNDSFLYIDQYNPSVEPLNATSGNNEGGIYQNISTIPNEIYDIEFEIENAIGGSTAVYIDDVLQTEKFDKGNFTFTYSFKANKDITKLEVKSRGKDYVYREIKSIKSKTASKSSGKYSLIPKEDANRLTNTCSVLNKQLFDKYYLTKEGLTKHIINSEVGTSLEVIQLNPEGTTVNGTEIPYIEKISIFKRVGDPLPEKYLYDQETKTLSLYVRPQDCEEVSAQDSLHYDLRYVSYLIESWFNYTTSMNIDDHIEFAYKKSEFSEKDRNILNKKYEDVYPVIDGQLTTSPYFRLADDITGTIKVVDHTTATSDPYGFSSTRFNAYYHRLSQYDIWMPVNESDFWNIDDANEIPNPYPNDLFGDSYETTEPSFYWPCILLNKCLGELSWQTASTYAGAPGDSIFAWELYSSGHLGFKTSESDQFLCLKYPQRCGFENASSPSMELDGALVSDGQEVFCTKNEWTTIIDRWASFNNFKDRYPTFFKDAYLIKFFPHYHPVDNWNAEHKTIAFINKDSSLEVSYYYNNNYYIVNEPIPFVENLEKYSTEAEEIFCTTSSGGVTNFTTIDGVDFIKSAAIDSEIKTRYYTDDRTFVVQDKIESNLRLGVLAKGYKSPKYYPEQSVDPIVVDKSKYFYFQLFSKDVTETGKVKFALVYVDESLQTEQSFGIYVFPQPADENNNYSLAFFNAYGITSETLRRVARILHHNKKYYPKLTENGSLPDYTYSQIFYDRN